MNEKIKTYLNDEVPLIADALYKPIIPCILGESKRAEEGSIQIGSSKFCGQPDVPNDFIWPITKDGPCWFIGQLNLKEVSKIKTNVSLPEEGIISFFYHDEGGPAGQESKVFYFPFEDSLIRADIVKDIRWGESFHENHLFTRTLELSQGYSLPRKNDLDLSESQSSIYEDLDDIIDEFNDIFCDSTHQFFGKPRYMWEEQPLNTMLASFGECNDKIRYFFDSKDIKENDYSGFKVIYDCT